MKRNAGCAVMIILGMLLAGCGNHTAAESTEMPEPDISSRISRWRRLQIWEQSDRFIWKIRHGNTTVQRNRPLWRHR